MTHDEAIQKLLTACQNAAEDITTLKQENAFLADTIEKHNLGKILKERKQLYSQISKANDIKLQYNTKLKEVNDILKDVRSKQDNINLYINKEIHARTQVIEKEYMQKTESLDKRYQEHIQDNDRLLQTKIAELDTQRKRFLTYAVLLTVVDVILLYFFKF